MSDTPRTDNEYRFKGRISENPCQPNEHSEWMAIAARKLERELAEAKARIAMLEQAGKNLIQAEGEDELLRAIRDINNLLEPKP
jgi:hypothetical protein